MGTDAEQPESALRELAGRGKAGTAEGHKPIGKVTSQRQVPILSLPREEVGEGRNDMKPTLH